MAKGIANLVSRVKKGGDQAEPAPSLKDEQQVLEDLRRLIESDIAAGFVPRDEIAETAAASMAGEADDAFLRREGERIAAEALAAHEAAQRDWPEVTDCDRLDAAFAALEASGVISRQNFTCCGTCGASEMWDEIDAARGEGRPVRGYAFFHRQETKAATKGRGLYLTYGACEEGEDRAVAVGHEIVAALAAEGLSTNWNGSMSHGIAVSLDWKRRSGPPPVPSGFTT